MVRKVLEYCDNLCYALSRIGKVQRIGECEMKKEDINRNIIENSYYMISLFYASSDETKEKNTITNLKLQKLMYFVEAYYMVKNKKESQLFDTLWSAWDYGPVNQKLYYYYKKFGSLAIKLTKIEEDVGVNLPLENKKYIEKVYNLFGALSAFELVTLTHLNDSPWSRIKNTKQYNFEVLNDSVIDKDDTKSWFEKKFEFLFTGEEEE